MGNATEHVHIAIVGSGFAGLGMAVQLKQAGIHDFVLFEREADVGGVWRDNSYPGCACDVESNLYSFSFAPNPEWTRLFSPRGEIYAYLQKVARDYQILPHVRFGQGVLEARWSKDAQRWFVKTAQGSFTADFVVSGMGALCEPSVPEIPGRASFAGEMFHSARWNHGYDFKGKRVAVIGTGASAIQFVPALQKDVAHLTLFQRTAAWVLPRLDRAVTDQEKALFRRSPLAQKAARAGIYLRREALVLGLRNPALLGFLERFALGYLERSVKDPEKRKKLTPDFRIGCKRILISRDYLRSLDQPNVAIETTGIREIVPSGIVTQDGVLHEVDAIVFGTGFKVTEMPFGDYVFDGDGRSLNEAWGHSPKAYLGTTVSGFPNLFTLLGPNTGLGHTSVVLMIEAQIRMVMDALKHMRAHRQDVLDVKPEVLERWVREIDAAGKGTVWTAGGCASWYLDQTGRNSTLWPSFTFSFMHKTQFRPREYRLSARSAQSRNVVELNGALGAAPRLRQA
jgi:cation diffusion facilitator CzcD-associated flavoprotein CzcO